jgi:two-component system response regulator YesN
VRARTIRERRRLYLLASAAIERRYGEQLTLDGVARSLAVSRRALQRAFAEQGGSTFREVLRMRRMQAAAELLIEQPSIAVGDVGRIVGYRRASHFSAAFAARYGLSPSAFRRAAIGR